MLIYVLALLIFSLSYLLNAATVTIFYHRALAHGSVQLSVLAQWYLQHAAIWVTGIDPVGWVCMHRRHHAFSDTDQDPHSPLHFGFFGVGLAQLKSYERTLVGIARKEKEYTRFIKDIDFEVNILNRKKLWMLPYLLHGAIALGLCFASPLVGLAYFLGLMSHPIEGWIINAFGHAIGRRNFDTNDNARNSHIAGYLVLGEGYQNNHHAFPASAKFSFAPFEFDAGYLICQILERFGLLKINRKSLIKNAIQKRRQERAVKMAA